jgi:hypothetical protein
VSALGVYFFGNETPNAPYYGHLERDLPRALFLSSGVSLMLGWLKNRITKRDSRARVIGEFRKRVNYIRTRDPETQLAFSTILATYWKIFIDEYKSPNVFAHLPQDQKISYHKQWIAMCQKLSNDNDTEKLIPAQIFVCYLAALMENYRDFEIEAEEFLDAYAREDWQPT